MKQIKGKSILRMLPWLISSDLRRALALQDALNPESQILPPRLDLKGHASEFAAPESCGVQNAS
ncbi:hypothetical protein OAH07_02245 [Verrucomicrobia bacterium]|nr:hypothetical protein [Verrucomicrobiota bacterium]MDC0266703.1 hypothetical protein [bacterium]